MCRRECLIAFALLAAVGLSVGLSQAGAGEASDGKAYAPIAPPKDLAAVQVECMDDLVKLAKTKPEKRRTWTKIRHRAWAVAEMANLLSLHKDAKGELPKRASAAAQAAAELGKIAKERQYDSVPQKVKALAEMVQAVDKLVQGGKTQPVKKPDFKPIAPVSEVMELNQEHYDEITELAEGDSPDDKAYAVFSQRAWILAESGNLLLLAHVDKKDWQKWSVEMRDFAKQLAAEAKKKDLPAIRKTVKAMETNCGACHDEYQ